MASLGLLGAAATPASAIVNGDAAPDRAFPWTVALVTAGEEPVYGQFCGGTLIAPNRVLTAMHCIDPGGANQATPDALDVLVGQTSLRATGCVGTCGDNGSTDYSVGVRIGVAQISLHGLAQYDPSDPGLPRYDAAILTLKQPVPSALWGAIVKPVPPSGENVAPAADELAPVDPSSPLATGWGPGTDTFTFGWGKRNVTPTYTGDTTSGTWDYPDVMRWVGAATPGVTRMERIADATCGARYGSSFHVDDMLCAGPYTAAAPAPDSCSGDSGGPLLRKSPVETSPDYLHNGSVWRLMGIVSWGPANSCGAPDSPGVYTRVGAQAIYDYVTSPNPLPAPTLVSEAGGPTITGSYASGTITCNSGQWNDATSFNFAMWRDANGNQTRDAATEPLLPTNGGGQYAVTAGDVAGRTTGLPIGCVVTAKGPGGYATAQAASLVDLTIPQAPPAPPPTWIPPTTPTPKPTLVDPLPPKVVKDYAVCGQRSCKVRVFVEDVGAPLSGLRKVTAKLLKKRRVTCKKSSKRTRCYKTYRTKVKFSEDDGLYTMKLRKLSRKDRLSLQVRAYDRAGNRKLLTITLKLRSPRSSKK